MKRILLFFAILPLLGTASVPVNPTRPEGTLKQYFLKANYYNRKSGSINWTKSLVGDVVWANDGKTVWFKNLFPYFDTQEHWTKGEVDGSVVTIMRQKVFTGYDDDGISRDLSIVAIEYNMVEDLVTDVSPSFTMTVDNDGNITSEKADDYYISLSEVDENGDVTITTIPPVEEGGDPTYTPNVYDLMQAYEYTPLVAGDTTKVQVPATAETKDFLFHYTNEFGGVKMRKAKMATVGGNVYLSGLCEDETAWVKGTVNGSTITIPSDQYVGVVDAHYAAFVGVSKLEISGMEYYAIDENFILTKSANDEWKSESMCGELAVQGIDLLNLCQNVKLTPFAGEVAAKPVAPHDLWLSDTYYDTQDCYTVGFTLENTGTNGEYLNEENLYYRLYLDGELYEFDSEIYTKDGPFADNLVPYLHSGYDLVRNEGTNEISIFFYESLWDTVGIQAVYKFGGTEYVSDMATIDFDVLKINDVKSATTSKSGIYDLQGRQLSQPVKGLNIINGKKTLIK